MDKKPPPKMYVWVWCDASKDEPNLPSRDPAEIPSTIAEAQRSFHNGLKGPRLVRLGKAMQMGVDKNEMCTVEEDWDGTMLQRKVPKSLVLPWYEGLLLLQELEVQQKQRGGPREQSNGSPLWEDKLQTTLSEERKKRVSLSSALYIEKKLMTVAVTGPIYMDEEGNKCNHRRQNLKDSAQILEAGQNGDGVFQVDQIDAYLPPWEAFLHPRCGLYQDFYRVRWGPPYSNIDYSGVENGCPGTLGATWEPDECLPPYLDSLRLEAKRKYLVKQQKLEKAQKLRTEQLEAQNLSKKANEAAETLKRKAESDVGGQAVKDEGQEMKKEEFAEAKPTKQAKKEMEDEKPKFLPKAKLMEDLVVSDLGHAWDSINVSGLQDVKTGWPKHLNEYPSGYKPCVPPGPCRERCDCMDDQRPQQPWETQKPWLANSERTTAVSESLRYLETEGQQKDFVRRRGTVTKRHFFETTKTSPVHNEPQNKSCLLLASAIMVEIKALLRGMTIDDLQSDSWSDPVHIPSAGWLTNDLDYLPIRYLPVDRNAFPDWLILTPSTGELKAKNPPRDATASVEVQLVHPEGRVAKVQIEIKPKDHRESQSLRSCRHVAQSLQANREMDRSIKASMEHELAQIFDFNRQQPVGASLGKCLQHFANLCLMARAASVGFTPYPK